MYKTVSLKQANKLKRKYDTDEPSIYISFFFSGNYCKPKIFLDTPPKVRVPLILSIRIVIRIVIVITDLLLFSDAS